RNLTRNRCSAAAAICRGPSSFPPVRRSYIMRTILRRGPRLPHLRKAVATADILWIVTILPHIVRSTAATVWQCHVHQPRCTKQPLNSRGFQMPQGFAISMLAPWWWWKAQPSDLCLGSPTTMIVIGIVLSFIGLGFLCWLLFALAVQALPFFVG